MGMVISVGLIFPISTYLAKVQRDIHKREISGDDYKRLADIVKYDPSLKKLASNMLEDDGIIDTEEYLEIGNLFIEHQEHKDKQAARNELKNQLSQP